MTSIDMLSLEEEEEENDFSSIVASSLRNVIEKSVANVILPYRMLSLSHLSSWITFEKDLIQILKQHSTNNYQNHQDLDLLHHFDCSNRHFNDKLKEKEDDYLFNSHIHFLPVKSDFDRLHQFMYLQIKPQQQQ